jgi:hypothetical protein
MADVKHRIWIAQVLCPSRHCIVAVSFDVADTSVNDAVAALRTKIATSVTLGLLNPWCGLCGSRVWTIAAGPTRWTTMAEAKPHLERLERENAMARNVLTQRGADQ